jgi:hypothetical protein
MPARLGLEIRQMAPISRGSRARPASISARTIRH